MLATTLNTNEIKNAAGVEQEFGRKGLGDNYVEYALIGEQPSTPHRLKCSHTETGTGTAKRRRSLVRFDKTIPGQVDSTKAVVISFYAVADIPIGNMTAYTEASNVCANLMSFMASLGATTTILYDGTGNGAATLINGTL